MNTVRKVTNDIAAELTERVARVLESGTIPWRKPWDAPCSIGRHVSVSSGKLYRGVNQLLLSIVSDERKYVAPYWMTYRQAEELGGNVRKGEKGTTVVYWKMLRVSAKDAETGEAGTRVVPMLRSFTVFNVAQVEALPDHVRAQYSAPERKESTVAPDEASERADAVILGYVGKASIGLEHGYGGAYYVPKLDMVRMPDRSAFVSAPHYTATLAHEVIHATGHPTRLDRLKVTGAIAAFGSVEYSREELVAELGASMLAGILGFSTPDVETNRDAYIQGWAKYLRNDPRALVVASGKAQDAANLVLGADDDRDTVTDA